MEVILSPIELRYHDLCSCLQSCMSTLLLYHGQDPKIVLGAVWDFYHSPEHFRREEYYYPCRWPSLASSLMPYHPITSRWHEPPDPETAWLNVKEAIIQKKPAIVAVDNFFLPFRPAYQDLHAGHLIVVYGFDDVKDEVYVADAPPPTYLGPMRIKQLQAARNSLNPLDEREVFFSSSPVANRWIEVEVTGEFPALTREWVSEVVSENLKRFHASSDEPVLSGLAGLSRYLTTLSESIATPEGNYATEELYVVGWSIQASTALHADFLMEAGKRLNWPHLAEAGRQVDRVAHHWTALRMLAAHARERPDDIAEPAMRVGYRISQLIAEQNVVLEQLDWTIRRS
jgi:hypothetical protein